MSTFTRGYMYLISFKLHVFCFQHHLILLRWNHGICKICVAKPITHRFFWTVPLLKWSGNSVMYDAKPTHKSNEVKKQYFCLFDCCTFGFMNLDTIYNTISKKIGIGKNPTNICSQQKIPKQRKKMMHMDFFYGGSAKPWVSTLKWSTVMWIIWRCPRLFEKTWKEACAVSFTPSWACNRRLMCIDLCCHPCADLDMLDELSVLTFISTNLITALTARP